jgi:ferrous iron transport protein B
MPNTGKSTFFNRLTGAGARVGNWPGITVDLLTAKLLLAGSMVEVVDLPGVYNLHGFSEDEQVVRRFLETQPVNVLILVLNSSQLDRQLALALQAKQLGIPMLLILNMSDEARNLGIRIDLESLESALECPVRLISAKFGTHCPDAKQALEEQLRAHPELRRVDTPAFQEDEHISQQLDRLVNQSVHAPVQLPATVTDKLDRAMLHPWLGIPLFFLIMYGLFQVVYGLGTPLQDGMEWIMGHVKEAWLDPALADLPIGLKSFVAEGLYDGLGTVLTFMPVIALFFLAMAIVEDSGYLARIAFLTDALMSRLGLDGRSFVMQLMGFGCNVPAIMGTRIMRSKGLRALTMLIIPFSLCSARLQVFLFITTAVFSPTTAPVALVSLYALSIVLAMLTAFIWRGRYQSHEPLLLELPPYRLPTAKFLVFESWRATKQFVQGAGGYIVLGVVMVWFLTHYPFDARPAGPATLAGRLADFMAPVFSPLGLDNLLAVALMFGFVAKEIVIGALAVIYSAGPDQLQALLAKRLDGVQAMSFLLFTLIYTPCLSTIATIRQESKDWRLTALAVVWPLALAWGVSFLFVQAAHMLGY